MKFMIDCVPCTWTVRRIFHMPMERYSLFVLKVPLNTSWTTDLSGKPRSYSRCHPYVTGCVRKGIRSELHLSVLYQVLNKQVPVPIPVHKAQVLVPVPVPVVQVPVQVQVPNLRVQVPVPVLCINYRHKVTQHKVKVVVCRRFNNQLVFWNTHKLHTETLAAVQTPPIQSPSQCYGSNDLLHFKNISRDSKLSDIRAGWGVRITPPWLKHAQWQNLLQAR